MKVQNRAGLNITAGKENQVPNQSLSHVTLGSYVMKRGYHSVGTVDLGKVDLF